MKFTHSSLAKFFEAKPRGICWDETRGLGAYRTSSGDVMLFVQYRLGNGKQRKKTLGKLPELPLQEFRALCIKYTMAARHGEDLVEAQRVKDEPRLSVGSAYEAYCMSLQRKGASPATLRLNAKNWTPTVEQVAGARVGVPDKDRRAFTPCNVGQVRPRHGSQIRRSDC
jgi:hypothetical protein